MKRFLTPIAQQILGNNYQNSRLYLDVVEFVDSIRHKDGIIGKLPDKVIAETIFHFNNKLQWTEEDTATIGHALGISPDKVYRTRKICKTDMLDKVLNGDISIRRAYDKGRGKITEESITITGLWKINMRTQNGVVIGATMEWEKEVR